MSSEKKETSGKSAGGSKGTSLSIGAEAVEGLRQIAREEGLTMTAYVRNIGLRKPAYAADVEAWINARMKKTGVSRKTVIERTLLFAMKSEERTGKEVI